MPVKVCLRANSVPFFSGVEDCGVRLDEHTWRAEQDTLLVEELLLLLEGCWGCGGGLAEAGEEGGKQDLDLIETAGDFEGVKLPKGFLNFESILFSSLDILCRLATVNPASILC